MLHGQPGTAAAGHSTALFASCAANAGASSRAGDAGEGIMLLRKPRAAIAAAAGGSSLASSKRPMASSAAAQAATTSAAEAGCHQQADC